MKIIKKNKYKNIDIKIIEIDSDEKIDVLSLLKDNVNFENYNSNMHILYDRFAISYEFKDIIKFEDNLNLEEGVYGASILIEASDIYIVLRYVDDKKDNFDNALIRKMDKLITEVLSDS